MFEERLERMRAKAHEFKQLRTSQSRFKMPFDWNPLANLRDVEAFERTFYLRLPEDYREFILKVGNGGLGPELGLVPLAEALIVPFPFGWNQTEERFLQWDDLTGHEQLEGGLALRLIPPQDEDETFLVIRGQNVGQLWGRDDEGPEGFFDIKTAVWQGETLVGYRQATFLDWYEDWLNDALNYLK